MTDEDDEKVVAAWLLAHFSKEDIAFGIDQYAQVKLQMTGSDFIAMVKRGESVSHLHYRAQEVADLVPLLDREDVSDADNG